MELNEQLLHISQSLGGITPEIFLTVLFCLVLTVELIFIKNPDSGKITTILHNICFLGALISLYLVINQWNQEPGFKFRPLLFLDHQAVFFKILINVAWLFALLHVRLLRYKFPPEFNAILIVTVIGLQLLVMATHLLSIYLSVELISISSYLLVALSPKRKAAEGSIKYLLFGAASSAVMLYGISFVYGLTGTLDITEAAMYSGLLHNSPFVIGATVVLVLSGLLFKLSLVPFHVWAPDVYEASPTPLVSFLSVAPKAAVILVVIRLAGALPEIYFPILGGIALISITIGNISALWQTNARRLLAYSSIAQAGYLLVGITTFSRFGFEATVFYASSYLLINMAAFFLIDLLNPQSETELKEYHGLGSKHIWVSGILTVVMIALAGLPPTVGFTAKLFVFSALWEGYLKGEANWMLWLLVGGILNAAIALAYYLRLPYLLFFKSSESGVLLPDRTSLVAKGVSALLLIIIIALFIKPEWLMNWIYAF